MMDGRVYQSEQKRRFLLSLHREKVEGEHFYQYPERHLSTHIVFAICILTNDLLALVHILPLPVETIYTTTHSITQIRYSCTYNNQTMQNLKLAINHIWQIDSISTS
jgi:hypothetical protein